MSTKTGAFNLQAVLRTNLSGFILVFLFHLAFKLLYINNSGFVYSETFNLFYAQQDWGLLKHISEWNRNAPLYYYFLSMWGSIFGISEFAFHFSSALFSSMAGGILFVFVSKHFNRPAAFIALAFFTISNSLYAYSQEASSQSIILFLSVASAYLFFELISKKSVTVIVLLGICNFLMIYGQYGTFIIPIIQLFVAVLFFSKEIFKRAGISFLVCTLLVAWRFTQKTLICVLYANDNYWAPMPSFDFFGYMFFDMFNGEMLFWIFLSILIVAMIYLLFSKQINIRDKTANLKFLSIVFFGPGAMFLSWALYRLMPDFSKAFFVFTVPFMYVLFGIVISKVTRELKYVVLNLTLFFCAFSFFRMNMDVTKPMDYKHAVPAIKILHNPLTVILVETRDVGPLFAYYFDKEIFCDFKNMEGRLKEKGIYLVSSLDDVKAIDFKKYKRAVLTQSFEGFNPDNRKLVAYIESQYEYHKFCWKYPEIIINYFGGTPIKKKIISLRSST